MLYLKLGYLWMRRKTHLPKSRSVELFNPSAYTGIFVRKFRVPPAYTRTNVTFALYNPLAITKHYSLKEPLETNNLLGTPWNVPDVYPLQNRRLILV